MNVAFSQLTPVEKANLQAKLDTLSRLLTNPAYATYEKEFRIGVFKGKYFESNIEKRHFYQVLDDFLYGDNYKYVPQPESIKTGGTVPSRPDVIISNTYRTPRGDFIRESYVDAPIPKRFYEKKNNITRLDFPNYNIRFAISKEEKLPDNYILPPGTILTSSRRKERWRFVDEKTPYVAYDFTRVTGWYTSREGKKAANSHEIEIEVLNPKAPPSKIWIRVVGVIMMLLQGKSPPISVNKVNVVTQGFNTLFNEDIQKIEAKTGRPFNRNKLVNIVNKPINLKLKYLQKADELAVSDKADGERKLMYFTEDGSYLLYPPFSVSAFYINRENPGKVVVSYVIPKELKGELKGTVIDGEVLYRGRKKVYLAFDILMDKGKDVRQVPFKERYKLLEAIVGKLTDVVLAKPFYFPSEDNFYNNVQKVQDFIEERLYPNDGMIFNNVNDPYNPAQIYKWKPPSQLTIDFTIEKIDSNKDWFKLYVAKPNPKKGPTEPRFINTLFKGTEKYPFDGVIKLPQSDLQTGQVVEMNWDYNEDKFEVMRVRFDRDHPNYEYTAKDIWEDIQNPISLDTILGHNLIMMRRLHNVIKSEMLKKNCKKSIIVDIGAGRGGDLHKWKELGSDTSVFAVEPNTDYFTEFKKRLLESQYTLKSDTAVATYTSGDITANLLQAYGQETDKIVTAYRGIYGGQKAGCIAIFNVLTFFFDKEGSMNSLMETIDKLLAVNGVFMGLVMDGEAVKAAARKNAEFLEKLKNLEKGMYWDADKKKFVRLDSLAGYYSIKGLPVVSRYEETANHLDFELHPDNDTMLEDYGWKIEKEGKFTDSPYGNKILINLGSDTIVHNQTEYLVDFEELKRKLSGIGVELVETEMLPADSPNLSPSQQRLSGLYRRFLFKRQPESERIIVEVKPAENSNFKCLKAEPALKPEEQRPVNIKNIDFVRVGIRDNTCLLRALIRASVTPYIKGANETGFKLTQSIIDMREKQFNTIFNHFLKNYLKDAYGRGDLPYLKKHFKTWSSAAKALRDCETWQWLQLWSQLSRNFKVNIVLVTRDNPYVEPTVFKYGNEKKTVIIYKNDGAFEVLAQKSGDGSLTTLFEDSDLRLAEL